MQARYGALATGGVAAPETGGGGERQVSQSIHGDSARAVFGRRAGFYTTSAVHRDPGTLGRLVELARPQPDWLAADVGCGTGHTTLAFAPSVRFIAGIDVTPEMLAEAERLRLDAGLTNVAFCIGDAEALPCSDDALDLVTCRRAAHHFHAIDTALAEMHRVLRPEGRLAIDDRSVQEDDFVDATMNLLDRHHDRSHVAEYRPTAWRRMLERQGFGIEAVEPYTLHRPLTSLTEGATPEDAEAVRALIASLSDDGRRRLNVTQVDGEPWLDHWYVMIVATRLA